MTKRNGFGLKAPAPPRAPWSRQEVDTLLELWFGQNMPERQVKAELKKQFGITRTTDSVTAKTWKVLGAYPGSVYKRSPSVHRTCREGKPWSTRELNAMESALTNRSKETPRPTAAYVAKVLCRTPSEVMDQSAELYGGFRY